MNEFYLLLGMVFMVAIATWAIMKTLTTPKKPKPTIEQEIKRSWDEFQRSKPPITLNEEAAGNEDRTH